MIKLENTKGIRQVRIKVYEDELNRIYTPVEGERFIIAKTYVRSNEDYHTGKRNPGFFYIASSMGAIFEVQPTEINIMQEKDGTDLIFINMLDAGNFQGNALVALPRIRLVYDAFNKVYDIDGYSNGKELAGKEVVKIDANSNSRLDNLEVVEREDAKYIAQKGTVRTARNINAIECFNLDGTYRCTFKSVKEFAEYMGKDRKNARRRLYADLYWQKVKNMDFVANVVSWKVN